MSKFKIGDRVLVNMPAFPAHNKTGTVEYISTPSGSVAGVRIDNEDRSEFYVNDLELIQPMNKFKLGDRVTVTNGKKEQGHDGHKFTGQSGRVVACPIPNYWKYYNLELDSGTRYSFYPDELSLETHAQISGYWKPTATDGTCIDWKYCNDFLATSPQPQQNKPKEENMRYTVITKNLALPGSPVVMGNHATEAEAKLQGEQLVAQHRANLTVKQYFTIAIVDMQTGKLVGSVSDAPPAVDWQV